MSDIGNDGSPLLDAAPLQDLIRADAAKAHDLHADADRSRVDTSRGLSILARRLDWNERTLYRLLRGQQVTLDMADRYCLATDRLLADVYPDDAEADTSELWRGTCPHCGIDSYLRIVAEGPRRVHLHCDDCDRGHYVQRPRVWRPAVNRRTDLDHAELVRLYVDEQLSLRAIAARLGTVESTIARHLEEDGVPRRSVGLYVIDPDVREDARRRGIATRRAQGARTTRAIHAMLAEGYAPIEIQRRLGISESGYHQARRRVHHYDAVAA